jgi:nucleotide-binding universal stress UspA family protein
VRREHQAYASGRARRRRFARGPRSHHRCRSAPFPAGRTSRSDHCRRFAPRKALQRAIDSEPFDRGDLGAVPPLPQPQMGTNVLIAWNCSTEQARVTAFAMPILKRASRVIVLTVERGAAVPGPTGQQLCRYLQLNEVPAKPLTVGLDGHVTGEAILAHANALGCDLLIKGAYTQSRLRQSSSAAPPATS